MSFISVLKKIGQGALPVINTALGLGSTVTRLVLPQTPGVVAAESEFDKIGGLVKTAEAVGQQVRSQMQAVNLTATGNKLDVSVAKAAALLPSVKTLILASNGLIGHQVVDSDRFSIGCQKILDGIVDVYDSVELARPYATDTTAGTLIPAK